MSKEIRETIANAGELDQDDDLKIEESKEIDRSQTIIRFEDVGLKFDDEVVLENITLDIQEDEFIYFVGQSGAGKSSLIKINNFSVLTLPIIGMIIGTIGSLYAIRKYLRQ